MISGTYRTFWHIFLLFFFKCPYPLIGRQECPTLSHATHVLKIFVLKLCEGEKKNRVAPLPAIFFVLFFLQTRHRTDISSCLTLRFPRTGSRASNARGDSRVYTMVWVLEGKINAFITLYTIYTILTSRS